MTISRLVSLLHGNIERMDEHIPILEVKASFPFGELTRISSPSFFNFLRWANYSLIPYLLTFLSSIVLSYSFPNIKSICRRIVRGEKSLVGFFILSLVHVRRITTTRSYNNHNMMSSLFAHKPLGVVHIIYLRLPLLFNFRLLLLLFRICISYIS